MGNQVSNGLKHKKSSVSDSKRKCFRSEKPAVIGILSFEVAKSMARLVSLYESLSSGEVFNLRKEIMRSEGVRYLVSQDEGFLLDLACTEKLDDLDRVANAVSRLGKRCREPALQEFESIYADLVSGRVDLEKLGFEEKEMEKSVKKMEKLVLETSNLYSALEILTEMEVSDRKLQQWSSYSSPIPVQKANSDLFQKKLSWQRQHVKHLRDVSLWNQTFDKIVAIMARTVCIVFLTICMVFGPYVSGLPQVRFVPTTTDRTGRLPSQSVVYPHPMQSPVHRFTERRRIRFSSGPLHRSPTKQSATISRSGLISPKAERDLASNSFSSCPLDRNPSGQNALISRSGPISLKGKTGFAFTSKDLTAFHTKTLSLPFDEIHEFNGLSKPQDSEFRYCGSPTEVRINTAGACDHVPTNSGRDCLSDVKITNPLQSPQAFCKGPICDPKQFGRKRRIMCAPPSTVGGSGLALRYSNVITFAERLLESPHLICDDARDDLYEMLPKNLKMSIRAKLKHNAMNSAMFISDPLLANDWRDAMARILGWLAPLAHDMIKWNSEHNYEHQHFDSRARVLLLQTLYFSDREKTEAAIVELLVGLSCICHYQLLHQSNGDLHE